VIKLPTEKRQTPLRVNPKRLIIYGKPKSGKTTILSKLDDTLIISLEPGGTDHLSGLMTINVIGLVPPKENSQVQAARHEREEYYLIEVIREIKRQKETTGKLPYGKIAIDTVTKLEEWCEEYATMKYMKSVQGKSFNRENGQVKPRNQWESVLTLPQGAGYLWLRIAFMEWIDMFDDIASDVILVAHLKDKLVNKAGKELSATDLNLTGRISGMLAASSDAIGYVYRKKTKTYINFKGGDDTCGSRCDHLKGKDILIMEEDSDGNVTGIHWDDIYRPTMS
jgi:hypothetical protein